jgi:hypothetical protein
MSNKKYEQFVPMGILTVQGKTYFCGDGIKVWKENTNMFHVGLAVPEESLEVEFDKDSEEDHLTYANPRELYFTAPFLFDMASPKPIQVEVFDPLEVQDGNS